MPTEITLFLLGLGALVVYICACAWWPYVKCPWPKCEGGKVRSFSGKSWRPHWPCGGSGKRVRIGRRVFDVVFRREPL